MSKIPTDLLVQARNLRQAYNNIAFGWSHAEALPSPVESGQASFKKDLAIVRGLLDDFRRQVSEKIDSSDDITRDLFNGFVDMFQAGLNDAETVNMDPIPADQKKAAVEGYRTFNQRADAEIVKLDNRMQELLNS